MSEEAPPELPPALRTAIAVVLGGLALYALASVALGLPPAPKVDAWLADMGVASLRMRLVGVFVVEGLLVLAVLVPLAVGVNVARALRG